MGAIQDFTSAGPIDGTVNTTILETVTVAIVNLSDIPNDSNVSIEVLFQALKTTVTRATANYIRLFNVLTIAGPGLTLKDSGDIYTFEEAALSGCDVGASVSGTSLLLEVTGIAATTIAWRATGRRVFITDPCFVAGTLVHTPNGSVFIEDLEVGDKVWTFDHDTLELVEGEVTALHAHDDRSVLRLHAGDESLTATGAHPFWLAEQERYLRLDNLEPGYKLQLRNGEVVVVDSIVPLDDPETVYNLTVEGHHNYFVGPSGILVHNK